MRTIGSCLAAAGLAVTASSGTAAQDLPPTHLKVVGAWGMLSQYQNFEQPFWTEQLSEATQGRVTAEITPFNEMGLDGAEIFRLMRLGVIDFGSTVLGYVAADDPRNEAIDLAGLAPDIETARAVSEAYKPVLGDLYREQFGIQVLGIWPYPAQVIYCNEPIGSLADLQGLKVRTGNRTLAEFVEALGGTGVTLTFSEVVQALENGVVDCAITGTLSGYSAKWHEVSTHLYALPVGWSQVMHAVNLQTWERLDPAVQDVLRQEIAALEDRIWEAADAETQAGIACNTGGPCAFGDPADMTLVEVSAEDFEILARVLQDDVVPAWAARCGSDCVEGWNETVGPVVGFAAAGP